jgi:hypothetical protein
LKARLTLTRKSGVDSLNYHNGGRTLAAFLTARGMTITAMVISLWIAVALAGYWAFYIPQVFASIQQTPAGQSTTIVRPGEPLMVERRLCLKNDVLAIVHAEFHDGVIFRVQDSFLSLRRGCQSTTTAIKVPHSLPPGPYIYRATLEYRASPFRTVNLPMPDIRFRLVGS